MPTMVVVDVWTGGAASALRSALRMTNDEFARELGTAVRTVAKWNVDPSVVPITEMQRALDTLLRRATPEVQERFAAIVTTHAPSVPSQRQASEETEPVSAPPIRNEAGLDVTLDWLDEHAHWPAGTARHRVAKATQRLGAARDREHARSRVGRVAITKALAGFYRPVADYAGYRVSIEGRPVETSVLTRPSWLDLRLVLGQERDRSSLAAADASPPIRLDELGADAAVRRVSATLASGGRMVNAPLYSLRHIDIANGTLAAEFGVTDFLSYALTLDLLENELIDALASGARLTPATLPLRQRYLPDLAAVTNLDQRLCAGGPAALFAAARKQTRRRPAQVDYVFLVQQRSPRTLNANRRLAVIPKAFHQPLVDFTGDTQVSATIEREMEEELFGREDLDDGGTQRRADPLHTTRLSPPMRWLMEHSDAETWRIECTGFGLNLVSGNFEFASLIVIDDDEWWDRFGGSIEANWEAEGLRRYSTLDRQGAVQLVQDGTWSNEGLFALLQGLRRLAETGGARVDLPPITLEM